MGQVLMDENRQFFMLCNNCHTDIKNMPEFRRHLEKCEGLENIFREGHTLKYNTDKSTQLFGKTTKGIKEVSWSLKMYRHFLLHPSVLQFLIYDYTDVEAQLSETEKNFIDLINIEEELLDPKWYSDISPEDNIPVTQKSSKQYEVLVEEVTPFVQFKENVKSNAHNTHKTNQEVTDINNALANVISAKKSVPKTKPNTTLKRKHSTTKLQNPQTLLPLPQSQIEIGLQKASAPFPGENAVQNPLVKRHRAENRTQNSYPAAPAPNRTLVVSQSKQPSVPAASRPCSNDMSVSPLANSTQTTASRSSQPAKEKQTAQILNKLQNLGLQVKRTQSFPVPNLEACKKTDDKTLEILMKLQSKGMKVKVLNKRNTSVATNNASHIPSVISSNFVHTIPTKTDITVQQNVNKNLIIRKVN